MFIEENEIVTAKFVTDNVLQSPEGEKLFVASPFLAELVCSNHKFIEKQIKDLLEVNPYLEEFFVKSTNLDLYLVEKID